MGINFPDGAQYNQAHIINTSYFTTTTRSTLGTTASNTTAVEIWNFTYNKKVASSHLILTGVMQAYGDRSGAVRCLTRVASGYNLGGWGMQYNSHNYIKTFPIGYYIDQADSTSGDIVLGFAYNAGNSSSGERPASIFNPDNNDDSRLTSGTKSYCIVMEYEP